MLPYSRVYIGCFILRQVTLEDRFIYQISFRLPDSSYNCVVRPHRREGLNDWNEGEGAREWW